MNRSKSRRNLWHFPDGHFETRVNRAGLIETTQSHWCAVKSTGDPTLILFLAICPTHTQRNNYNLNFSSRGQAADLIHYTLGLALPVTNDIIVENPLIANEWRGGKMMMGGGFIFTHTFNTWFLSRYQGLVIYDYCSLEEKWQGAGAFP